ncbi:MAG: hypothetical protein ABL949_11200 [Fimbriimonadaceae bacterium]
MRLFRLLAAFGIGLGASSVHADWTVTHLHPSGGTNSFAYGVGFEKQAGMAMIGDVVRASLWSGSSASWVDINPSGATFSVVNAIDGTKQFGHARWASGGFRAGYWTGSAASWVSLHPSAATESRLTDAIGGQQVGYITTPGAYQACLWNGTAASFVNLHPAGATLSQAFGAGDGKQVGYALVAGRYDASLWNGAAAGWVNLSPTGSVESSAECVGGGRQGGYAAIGGFRQAGLWSGTAASWVSLHPTGAAASVISDMSGDVQVGYAKFGTSNHAGVWTGTASSFVDLHSLLPIGYTSSQALGVWRSDTTVYVVGSATNVLSQAEAVMWSRPLAGGFSLTLNKSSVAGQNSVLGTITMDAAPTQNAIFNTYDNSSLVTTPISVTVLMNTTTRNFQVTTAAITSTVNATIFAQRGSQTRSQTLTLIPLIPTALSFTPTEVIGGQSTSCRVVINGVAGPGGRTIAMLDNSPNAEVPATIVVPAGATSVTFPITTTAVTSQKTVTVTARVSAGEKTGTFRINPL